MKNRPPHSSPLTMLGRDEKTGGSGFRVLGSTVRESPQRSMGP